VIAATCSLQCALESRKKDEALEMFKRFIAEECEPKGFEVKILRSDNGGTLPKNSRFTAGRRRSIVSIHPRTASRLMG
jgi:hypothetical protein